jgi:hypothetical protein
MARLGRAIAALCGCAKPGAPNSTWVLEHLIRRATRLRRASPSSERPSGEQRPWLCDRVSRLPVVWSGERGCSQCRNPKPSSEPQPTSQRSAQIGRDRAGNRPDTNPNSVQTPIYTHGRAARAFASRRVRSEIRVVAAIGPRPPGFGADRRRHTSGTGRAARLGSSRRTGPRRNVRAILRNAASVPLGR